MQGDGWEAELTEKLMELKDPETTLARKVTLIHLIDPVVTHWVLPRAGRPGALKETNEILSIADDLIGLRRARGGGVSMEIHLQAGQDIRSIGSSPLVREYFDKGKPGLYEAVIDLKWLGDQKGRRAGRFAKWKMIASFPEIEEFDKFSETLAFNGHDLRSCLMGRLCVRWGAMQMWGAQGSS